MTYHFYSFVGKFPKLFNFSDGKEKNYLVELNRLKENAFCGLQKILLDNFSRNFYIWSAIVIGTCMQKIKIGHRAKFRAKTKCSRRFYFRFARFYAAFNFRWAYLDSFSWRVHLGVDCRTLPGLSISENFTEGNWRNLKSKPNRRQKMAMFE